MDVVSRDSFAFDCVAISEEVFLGIFANGAHGSDIAEDAVASVSRGVWLPLWLRDDDPAKDNADPPHSDRVTPDVYRWVVGINDSARRRELAARLDLPWFRRGVWVHRKATIGPDVTIGNHTHINAGAFLTRCTLGDFVTVGPNATICGDVTIGDDVMIGAGAVIRNLLTIGDGAVIGCGAVVVEDVPAGVTVVGNPARQLVKS